MESKAHKRAKAKASGRSGKKEVPLSRSRRLDALSKGRKRATEVERSGSKPLLEKAAGRLKASGAKQKVLQVPNKDMSKAVAAMRVKRVKGTIKNMSETKRIFVK